MRRFYYVHTSLFYAVFGPLTNKVVHNIRKNNMTIS